MSKTYQGYQISKGSYAGVADDNIDEWYIDMPGEPRYRTGPGYRTLREARLVVTARVTGERIGQAMARDAIAEDMPRKWTGLDPQDGDQLTAAGIEAGSDEWRMAETAAREAYHSAVAPASPVGWYR